MSEDKDKRVKVEVEEGVEAPSEAEAAGAEGPAAPQAEEAEAAENVETVEAAEPVVEMTEEEMVEAAKRAGEAAAEADFKADAERARTEAGDLLAQLAEAQDVVEAAKKEASTATDRLARLQADWENFRRRTAAERLAEKERAAEKLVLGLLPVLDDMERASSHAREAAAADGKNDQFDQYVAGVDAVHDKMVSILAKEGVEVIDPVGEAFDPLQHQAVGRVEDTEAFDETVAQVYQKGYAMGGKVIRAAMVTVTYGGPKRPVAEPEPEAEAKDEAAEGADPATEADGAPEA